MRPFSILGTWVISCHATSYIPHFKHPPCPIYPQFYTFDILTNRRPVFAASSMMTVCHFYIWSEGGNRRLGVGSVVAGTCGHRGKGGSWPEPEIPAASCQHTFILMSAVRWSKVATATTDCWLTPAVICIPRNLQLLQMSHVTRAAHPGLSRVTWARAFTSWPSNRTNRKIGHTLNTMTLFAHWGLVWGVTLQKLGPVLPSDVTVRGGSPRPGPHPWCPHCSHTWDTPASV